MSQHAVSRFIVKHLEERHARVIEKMEKGLEEKDYRIAVGQCRELRELMSFVPELIAKLEDDDDGNTEPREEGSREGRQARPARRSRQRGSV